MNILYVFQVLKMAHLEDFKFINFKCKNARNFIEAGNKVKFTIRFRGRELNNTKAGELILNKFAEQLSDIAQVDKKPFLEGKTMMLMLSKK